NEKGNRDPIPVPVVSRVLAGESVTVNIPLDGIDPDGDSVQLLGFPSSPTLGSVTDSGPGYFVYQSSAAAAGTDTFSYQVYDAYGATGDGEVKIAVIPQPKSLQPPDAVPDNLSVRPGRIAQADLLANDSDPQGAPIKVSKKLIDVPKGIDAKIVDGQYLVVKAPNTEQTFSVRYELTNNRGGSAMSYALVKVTAAAPLLPPVASDYAVKTKAIAGKKTADISLFPTSAFNPSGLTDDMKVTFEGPNASSAVNLSAPGKVRVTPGKTRQAIAYRVTNEKDHLSAVAFILVPAAVTDSYADPPIIDPALPTQYVSMNETKTWNLKDILKVPSGRDAWITDKKTVSALQSNGDPIYVDKDTLKFTPVRDYRGPASINFTVTDGASLNDPKGNKANLRLNIVVGDPQFRDTPPEFTSPDTQVEVGEKTTIDLRKSTAQPNPQILQEVTYSDISSDNSKVTPSLNGSELTISTPRNTPKGTTATLKVTLRSDKFTVPGTIQVTVVGSTRPLAVAVTDAVEAQRGDPATVVHPLTNDSNPFQTTGEPLTVVDAQVQNTGEPATISFTKDSVKIVPSPTLKSGVVEVVYTVQDATDDKDRRVNGTITLTVSDVPDQVQKPTRAGNSAVGGDGTATFGWQPPATNGKPITGYHLTVTPSATIPSSCTSAGAVSCTLTGLANGTAYTITVAAENMRGRGAPSVASDPVTPYGTPSAPVVTATVLSKWAPTGVVQASWAAVNAAGGSTTYYWSVTGGQNGTTTGTSTPQITGLAAGTYTFTVYAKNSAATGGKQGANGTASAVIQNQTKPGAVGTPSGSPTNASSYGGNGSIYWTWPAMGGGEDVTTNLKYTWNLTSGQSGTTTNTSVTTSGLPAGTYRLTVTAANNAGSGPPSSASALVTITQPDKPQPPSPSITLSRGADAPGTGYYYHVALNNFTPGTNVTMICYDNGNQRVSQYTFTKPWNFNGDLDCYSGFPSYYVTGGGATSNTVGGW
ncbi:MAG: Ig-like domain-containing protein, partial [Lacisediminihabitans sp.]